MRLARRGFGMLLCSLSTVAATMFTQGAYACVGGSQEVIDVTWQAFPTAATGTETIGGMTISSDGSNTFTADDVANTASGGSVPGLSITSSPTDWTVSSANASTDSTFTSVLYQPMAPNDASASGSGATPSFIEVAPGSKQTCGFKLTGPAQVLKDHSFSFTVTAVDNSNAVTPGYTGAVQFQVTNFYCCGQPIPNSTLTNGVGTFSYNFGSTGPNTITASDTQDGSVNGALQLQVVDPTTLGLNSTPGATLLFPYFEVDPSAPNGRDTLMSLQNTSATAVLNHVTVWTDLGYPVLGFNIYLTGYDVESIDLYDMLINGNVPITASAGQDPGDRISPKGQYSQDINFASCYGQFPYPQGALVQTYRNDLRAALTGHSATFLNGQCSGYNHGDSIMRGYVTVDTVNNCTTRQPTDVGYFSPGGSGDVTNQNVMAGEYFLVDAGQHLLQSDMAVAVHADPANPDYSTSGKYTFYGHVTSGTQWSAADNRQPLPNTWAVDGQAAGTEVIVWRDLKVRPSTFACSNSVPPASGVPMSQEAAFSFDNRSNPVAIPAGTPFGLATQRVALGTAQFPVAPKPGWAYLGLSYTNNMVTDANAPADPAADQAFVSILQYPESNATSTGTGAISLDSGQAANHSHPTP